MASTTNSYGAFLQRLKGYERLEPFPRSRGPEKLAGVKRMAGALGHPERAFSVVHVAGTNGKGMTAAMIARLLDRAGLATGLYTSPHVADIRERIVLRGALVAEALFAKAGHRVLDLADTHSADFHFSFFDLLTLIALEAFREDGLEWVVLETGLGGLSDATNIVPKNLAVLTRIGLDHQHLLGEDLKSIAGNKLGIVQAGVPTVLAGQPPGLESWMARQIEASHSTVLETSRFRIAVDRTLPHQPALLLPHGPSLSLSLPHEPSLSLSPADGQTPPLPHGPARGRPPLLDASLVTGPRLICAANALTAAEHLLGSAEGEALSARLATVLNTKLPGRLDLRHHQRISGGEGSTEGTTEGSTVNGAKPAAALPETTMPETTMPETTMPAALDTVVLDGGHNPDAIQALCDQLAHWNIRQYTLLISLQKDKLVSALEPSLKRLLAGARRIITLAPQNVRAPQRETLHAFLSALLPPGKESPPLEEAETPRTALLRASETPRRPLVAAGSLWMMGDVIQLLEDL